MLYALFSMGYMPCIKGGFLKASKNIEKEMFFISPLPTLSSKRGPKSLRE